MAATSLGTVETRGSLRPSIHRHPKWRAWQTGCDVMRSRVVEIGALVVAYVAIYLAARYTWPVYRPIDNMPGALLLERENGPRRVVLFALPLLVGAITAAPSNVRGCGARTVVMARAAAGFGLWVAIITWARGAFLGEVAWIVLAVVGALASSLLGSHLLNERGSYDDGATVGASP